jgi:hypothetical protein
MEHEAHEAHEKASSALFAARQAHAAAAIREEEGVPGAEQEERAARRDVALKSRAEAKAARSLERAERATDHAVEEEATASEELPAERGPNHDADLAQARAKEAEWSQRLVTATARADTSAAMAKDSGRALSKIRATYDKGTAEDRDRIEAAEESHAEAEGRAESQDAWAARVDDIHAIWANRRETLDHRGTADR